MKTLVTVGLCLAATLAFGATVGSDSAANYTGDGFTNGANKGTGFQPWNIFAVGSGGTWVGDSTEGCGDINTAGVSFGMWGNVGAGNWINCYRKFAGGALAPGQKFSINVSVNWRNGNKGFDLLANGVTIFNFNVGGDNYWWHTNVPQISLGWGWAEKRVIACTFEQKENNVVGVTLTSGSDEFQQDLNLAGPADELKLYCGETDSGNNNNFYANSLVTIPEPAALLALLAAGLLVRARRG